VASRRKPVPAVPESPKRVPGPYERQILSGGSDTSAGISKAVDYAHSAAARAEAAHTQSPATAEALEAAREGDTSALMPYAPTPSINPPRPRTRAAGYDRASQTVYVGFRDGAVYAYFNVPPRVWANFKRVKSPGRAINRTLNNYEYARMTELEG
jgi:hypothetical protein